MDIYRDLSSVVLTVPYISDEGVTVIPVTAAYRVIDEDGTEVVVSTPISITAGDVETVITVGSAQNTLAVDQRRAMRTVELTMTDSNGSIFTRTTRYIVEALALLTVYVNSMLTYDQAELVAMDIPGLTSWDNASSRQRMAALTDAFSSLSRLSYVIEDARSEFDYIWGGNTEVVENILDLTPAEFAALPAQFLSDMQKAQVAEADTILGGDDVANRRRRGLMSETIGESSMMFRPGKPINLPLGTRALRYLTGYISFNRSLTRI